MPLSHRIRMPGFPDCQIPGVVGPLQKFAGANDEPGRPDYDLRTAATPTEFRDRFKPTGESRCPS